MAKSWLKCLAARNLRRDETATSQVVNNSLANSQLLTTRARRMPSWIVKIGPYLFAREARNNINLDECFFNVLIIKLCGLYVMISAIGLHGRFATLVIQSTARGFAICESLVGYLKIVRRMLTPIIFKSAQVNNHLRETSSLNIDTNPMVTNLIHQILDDTTRIKNHLVFFHQLNKMVALQELIIPLFSFIFFVIFLHKWRSGAASTPQKKLPPSPTKLPIIGNLHQLGTSPHRSLQSLSNRYGKLLLLHFGRVPVLIVSSAEAAREIMKNQDLIFSNRPKLSIPDRLIYGSRDVAFAPYGEYWRKVRSISVLQLLSNKRVQSCRRVREEETSAMVEKIKQLGSSSTVVNLSVILMSLTKDVVCRVALGRKYGDHGEDKKFKNILVEFEELLGATSLGDYIPWLGWIDRVNGLDARIEKIAKQFDAFFEVVLQEHKDAKKRDDDIGGDGELDFVDILLQFQKENEAGSTPIDDDTIKAIILGSCWNEKDIGEDDLEKMSYLKAVMKESLRLHSPVPLLLPRESTQDTKIVGYDIAAGTQVMINAWAIGRDPSLWENPEKFRPERFLDSSIDFRGIHFELIPFGAGRRGCPGIAFAMAVDELALAKLVHNFNFALPNGRRCEDLDMSETIGLTVHKKLPLLVVTTPRSC
ncbi:hypothetical protein DH2020_042681 [Rehmannia glutinosa]|uniref:Uncharacterized protein n=1 Tax=Rehmannia glutinosa TaxID=99300 RepID=A0ABR0ULS9_REHGL